MQRVLRATPPRAPPVSALALTLTLLLTRPLPAQQAPVPTAEEAAAELVAAKDDAALAALAARDFPDPWSVADELLALGQQELALRFARASPRKDVEALPAALAAVREQVTPPEVRRAYKEAVALWREGRREEALTRYPPPRSGSALFAARIEFLRGRLLYELRRPEEGVASFELCATLALDLGWLAQGSDALGKAAFVLTRIGQYPRALPLFERALPLLEMRGDEAALAEALQNLSAVLSELGRHREALPANERATALYRRRGNEASVATGLCNRAIILALLGEAPGAAASATEALAIAERLHDEPRQAAALGVLGAARLRLGDHAAAYRCQRQSLAIEERLGDPRGIATALGDLANVLQRLGDDEEALRCFEKADALLRSADERPLLSVSEHNLGLACVRLGRRDEGLRHYREALRLSRERGDLPGVGAALEAIGRALLEAGEPAEAIRHFEEAIELFGRMQEGERRADAMEILAHALQQQGKQERALALRREAVAIAEASGSRALLVRMRTGMAESLLASREYRRAIDLARETVAELPDLVRGLADEERARLGDVHHPIFQAGAGAASELGRLVDLAFFLEAGRAAALIEGLGGREALRSAVLAPKARTDEAKAREAEARAAAAYRAAGDDLATLRQRKAELVEARRKREEAVRQIQREEKSAAALLFPEVATLPEMQASLAPDEALLLYFHTPPLAIVLVVTSRGASRLLLGGVDAIDAACAALGTPAASIDPIPAIARLRELVAKPLALSSKIRRVLVSPYKSLSFVPFCLLFPGHEVVMTPSGTTLRLLRSAGDPAGTGVLAVGDPDYDTSGTALPGLPRLARLPGSRDEARAVGDVVLLGKDASEGGLVREIASRERWRAVHLACHGSSAPFPWLALSPGDDADGLLTALDLCRLRVPAQLVVLSGCETGRGRLYKSEGVVGLARAFMLAGSPRVIASLWKVDDEATRALMTQFYKRWRGGAGAAAALKQAQESVASEPKWRHPFYWAAWHLWGLGE